MKADIAIKPPADYHAFYQGLAATDLAEDIVPARYKRAQLTKLLKVCGDTQGLSVLEIGPGKDGAIVHLTGCKRRVAVDIAPAYLARLPEGIEFYVGFAEKMPYVSEFDLIVCTDVLEHVLHPNLLLSAIHRALKPHGKAIIRVPYREDLSQYVGTKWEGCHLRTFDDKSLTGMLEANHLHVKSLGHGGYDLQHMDPKLVNHVKRVLDTAHLWNACQQASYYGPGWVMKMVGCHAVSVTAVCMK